MIPLNIDLSDDERTMPRDNDPDLTMPCDRVFREENMVLPSITLVKNSGKENCWKIKKKRKNLQESAPPASLQTHGGSPSFSFHPVTGSLNEALSNTSTLPSTSSKRNESNNEKRAESVRGNHYQNGKQYIVVKWVNNDSEEHVEMSKATPDIIELWEKHLESFG
ncbi:hypothetical protein NPIL_199781 [Nephila pilipes]|uniref:Chromo domain-containing protein n=1 Tax=Nephila pilipes TaxID=299642 RepID=A0A8X6UJS6_NEPPI|nr:hypothetical protein NPIL_199781 [Nephila pilipes]